MNDIQFFLEQENIEFEEIQALPASGGDRAYFRIQQKNNSLICTKSNWIEENETFFSFTKTFKQLNLNVPELIAINKDKTIYVQQDLGTICLLDLLLENGTCPALFALYKTTVIALAKLQITSHSSIDYNLCLVSKQFDEQAALNDLNYFYEYYASLLPIQINDENLKNEFAILSKQIGEISPCYFMYRDCQGRNIMVKDEQIYFIDYQGGMKGPMQYDIASLLWQAKAKLSPQWKTELFEIYKKEVTALGVTINEPQFTADYNKIVFMRLLQVLGAYGRRGLKEGKAHFIASIPLAIENIIEWKETNDLLENYPTLNNILDYIITTKQQ